MKNLFFTTKTDYYISSRVCTSEKTAQRKVDCYELELYTTATNISVVNGIEHKQKRGNILLGKPGDVRYSIHPFECLCVHFQCYDTNITQALEKLPTVFLPANGEKIQDTFQKLIDAPNGNDLHLCLYRQGIMAELIGLVLYAHATETYSTYPQYKDRLFLACQYMKENLEQPLTLTDIANKVNLSPGFFHKVFKAEKRVTPSQYLTALRVETAKEMLKKTNTPFSEIAVLCGFNSQAYLNYVFLKNTDMTPKQYREKYQIII